MGKVQGRAARPVLGQLRARLAHPFPATPEGDTATIPTPLYTWLVFEDGYRARGAQDHQDYIADINSVRDKYHLHLVPVTNGNDVIDYLNNGQDRGRIKVVDFEYFGHSNRCCFMFDYSNNIDSASKNSTCTRTSSPPCTATSSRATRSSKAGAATPARA